MGVWANIQGKSGLPKGSKPSCALFFTTESLWGFNVHLNVKERLPKVACRMLSSNSHVRKLHSVCHDSQDTWVNGQYSFRTWVLTTKSSGSASSRSLLEMQTLIRSYWVRVSGWAQHSVLTYSSSRAFWCFIRFANCCWGRGWSDVLLGKGEYTWARNLASPEAKAKIMKGRPQRYSIGDWKSAPSHWYLLLWGPELCSQDALSESYCVHRQTGRPGVMTRKHSGHLCRECKNFTSTHFGFSAGGL